MNDIDIARKIADEAGESLETAEGIANRLKSVHPDLQPVVAAWLNGEEIPFEFKGVSLDAIRKRDKSGYASAILTMNLLLKKPEYADGFLTRKMDTEDVEITRTVDVDKVAKKIADETGTDIETAKKMAISLMMVHPDLGEVIEVWISGQELPFERYGVSLDKIMRRNKCKYIYAIFTMSSLLENPELAKAYSRPQIIQ